MVEVPGWFLIVLGVAIFAAGESKAARRGVPA